MEDSSGATPPSPSPDRPAIDPERLKGALTVFKKRLKVTRLDDESKLGGGRPTTTGKKSAVMGIQPPREYPREIWDELARQGKIKDLGGGFYTIP